MTWLLLLLITIGVVEILIRARVGTIFSQVRVVLLKSQQTLSSEKISDHWKEKVLQVYALKLFSLSFRFLIILICIIICIMAGDLLAPGFIALLLSIEGIVVSMLLATAYGYARSRMS